MPPKENDLNLEQYLKMSVPQTPSTSLERKLICSRVARISDLPIPPTILSKLFDLLQDGKYPPDFWRLQVIHGPATTASILKRIYEIPENRGICINSIQELLTIISPEDLYIILSEMTPMEDMTEADKALWKHCYSTHIMMHNIIDENGFENLKHLALVALIHDIGKIVMNMISPKNYQAACDRARNDSMPVHRCEYALMQIDHAEIGGMLLRNWNFPEEFCRPIENHHCDHVPPDFILETALLQFVDWVDCTLRGLPCFEIHKDIMNAAGIEEIDIDYWMAQQRDTIQRSDSIFEPAGDLYSDTSTSILAKEKLKQQGIF